MTPVAPEDPLLSIVGNVCRDSGLQGGGASVITRYEESVCALLGGGSGPITAGHGDSLLFQFFFVLFKPGRSSVSERPIKKKKKRSKSRPQKQRTHAWPGRPISRTKTTHNVCNHGDY